MSTKTSLFSRPRPFNPTKKRMRGFLALAAELRNEVYEYYFQQGFRCEIAAKGTQFALREYGVLKLWVGITNPGRAIYKYCQGTKPDPLPTVRVSRRLGKYLRVHGVQTNWDNSLCPLILVCKQVYRETIAILYRKTTFVFDAPKRILNFTEVIPTKNLALITKLQLDYTTYGEPDRQIDRKWRNAHMVAWTCACKSLAKNLVNLQVLELNVREDGCLGIHHDLEETWIQPLLQLRGLSSAKRTKFSTTDSVQPLAKASSTLPAVNVRVDTDWSFLRLLQSNPDHVWTGLHQLYEKGVSQIIMGANEQEAMAEFMEAWEEAYVQ